MTPEERESIILEAVERTILMIPEVIGNVIKEKVSMNKLTKTLYDNNKNFLNHKEIVASTIEQKETENPGKPYDEIVKLAVPEINRRIGIEKSVDNTTANKPKNLGFNKSGQTNNGMI